MATVKSGMIWSFVERFSTQGIGFIISILLARIISPESYGIIAMVQVFLSISQVFIDGGFVNALIQKQNRTDDDFNTAFIFNMGVACFFYAILFVASPLIADFYNEPQLKILTRFIGLNLILSSFSIVQRARLTINLDFKTQSIAGLASVLIGGSVGLICAYNGYEVWSLIVQGLVSQLVASTVLIYLSRWFPNLSFSKESFKLLFGFGSKLLLNNLYTSFCINFNNLIIGKWYSAAQLAYYNKAFTLALYPSTNIEGVLQRIIYPITCKCQHDKVLLKQTYYKYLHLSNLIIMALLTILIVLSKPLVSVLLTDKWLPMVPYFQLYCINFFIYPWVEQSSYLILSTGNSKVILKFGIIIRTLGLLFVFCAVKFGVLAICIATVIGAYTEFFIHLWMCRKYLGYSIKEQVKTNADVLLTCALTAILLYVFQLATPNVFVQLFGGGSIGLASILLFSKLFGMSEWNLLKLEIGKWKRNY